MVYKLSLCNKPIFESDVQTLTMTLQVGDFIWVAQAADGRELVLDCVVERKRLDDLAGSIIGRFYSTCPDACMGSWAYPFAKPLKANIQPLGGRFAEQKLRLKSCGVKHRVYLVESKSSYISLPETTLHQAVINTQVSPILKTAYSGHCLFWTLPILDTAYSGHCLFWTLPILKTAYS